MVDFDDYKANEEKKKPEEHILKPSVTLEGWPEVKGINHEVNQSASDFINSMGSIGFQASSLARAIDLVERMRKDRATIFFGFTSNMISCGVRESIKFLAKHSMVDVMVTTAGGIEEDVIKCIKPFVHGDYDAHGETLRDKGVNRTGNIFVPNDRYLEFERFFSPFIEKLYKIQKKENRILHSREIVYLLGKEMEERLENYEDSVIYWAYKNKIPYFCSPINDGSIGDMIYFFKQKHPDFMIESSNDFQEINEIAVNAEKSGIIAIGGSVPKHMISNANLYRDGADYAVYINTASEYEGSNAGANPDEAVSWGKILKKDNTIKVYSEASIVFPLLVEASFAKEIKK